MHARRSPAGLARSTADGCLCRGRVARADPRGGPGQGRGPRPGGDRAQRTRGFRHPACRAGLPRGSRPIRQPSCLSGPSIRLEAATHCFDFRLQEGRRAAVVRRPVARAVFHQASQKVYIANWGASRIDRIVAGFGPSTTVEAVAAVPTIGAPAARAVANPDGSSDQIQFGLVTPPAAVFPNPNAMASRPGPVRLRFVPGAVFVIRNAATCATSCPMEPSSTTAAHHRSTRPSEPTDWHSRRMGPGCSWPTPATIRS